MPNKSGKT